MTQETDDDIADFVKYVDERFGTGPDTNRATCMTGDPVVTLVRGVKNEGGNMPFSDCALMAWQGFKDGFEEYAEGKAGPVYWRMKPEFHQDGDRWHVRARLFIQETPMRRHIGTFRLSGQDMIDKPCQLMEIMGKCIILKAEPLVYADATEYTAMSPLFAVNPEGQVPLHYEWIKNDCDEWVVK